MLAPLCVPTETPFFFTNTWFHCLFMSRSYVHFYLWTFWFLKTWLYVIILQKCTIFLYIMKVCLYSKAQSWHWFWIMFMDRKNRELWSNGNLPSGFHDFMWYSAVFVYSFLFVIRWHRLDPPLEYRTIGLKWKNMRNETFLSTILLFRILFSPCFARSWKPPRSACACGRMLLTKLAWTFILITL